MTAEQLTLLVALEIASPVLGSKRYLCDVREQTCFDRRRFDAVALNCHRDGLALLSRDDLNCDHAKQAASEITDLTETHHFVEPNHD